MNIEEFREYCLSKKGVSEEFPFGPDTLVYKVMGKIFALTGLDSPDFSVNLKCEPEMAEDLREKYMFVKPGYHMNKKHWNTINFDDANVGNEILSQWIDISYQLVVESLPKKLHKEIE